MVKLSSRRTSTASRPHYPPGRENRSTHCLPTRLVGGSRRLYRLVFPAPEEIPIPKKTAPAKAARPAAPGAGGVSPF